MLRARKENPKIDFKSAVNLLREKKNHETVNVTFFIGADRFNIRPYALSGGS
jgi:hypothetical protein